MPLLKITQVSTSSRPTTTWNSKRNAFVINLPKAIPASASTSQAGFSSDLLSLFSSPSVGPSDGLAGDSEAWADLSLDPETHPFSGVTKPVVGSDMLPDVSSIERPEELTKRPPYWLIVREESRIRIVIQGSHGPSLILLESYLKKWCRGDVNRVERVCYLPFLFSEYI
jgi:hypothetical protein